MKTSKQKLYIEMESFFRLVKLKAHFKDQHNENERIVLKKLKDHTDITITKADKGGAKVFMDVEDYVNEAHRQLNDKDHYKKMNEDH